MKPVDEEFDTMDLQGHRRTGVVAWTHAEETLMSLDWPTSQAPRIEARLRPTLGANRRGALSAGGPNRLVSPINEGGEVTHPSQTHWTNWEVLDIQTNGLAVDEPRG